jgi:uncharacterized protein (DUF2141 family)
MSPKWQLRDARGTSRAALRGLALAVLAVLCSKSTTLEAAPEQRAEPKQTTLHVHFSEIRNAQGRLAVALFNSDDAFPDQKKALQGKTARIVNGKASVRFDGLAPGTYAVAVLHDENANDRMDFNFVGMPLEGFGFSNDAAVWFGPPSFSSAAVRVGRAAAQLRVKVRYFSL